MELIFVLCELIQIRQWLSELGVKKYIQQFKLIFSPVQGEFSGFLVRTWKDNWKDTNHLLSKKSSASSTNTQPTFATFSARIEGKILIHGDAGLTCFQCSYSCIYLFSVEPDVRLYWVALHVLVAARLMPYIWFATCLG